MKPAITITSALLTLSVLITSCKDRTKLDDAYIVPDDAIVNILTDTYLAEALMDVASVRSIYQFRDSISNVKDITGHYGYTKAQLDSTLKYYFLYKPKKFEKLYDRVTGNLLEMEANLNTENNQDAPPPQSNLWNGKASYLFPDEYRTDSIAFSIPLPGPGLYRFKAFYLLYADDQSIDPQVKIYFTVNDKENIDTIMWEPYALVKDGKSNLIRLEKRLDNPGAVKLEGNLFSHSNKGIKWRKHARIMGIVVEKEQEESDEAEKRVRLMQ